jgi:uncharacterized membrane-anchored protein
MPKNGCFRVFVSKMGIAFWLAYILTRPLGASFADWTGKPHSASGLGLGDGLVGIGLTILIIGFVGYMTFSRGEAKRETSRYNSTVRRT